MQVGFQLTQQDFLQALQTHRNRVSFRKWTFLFVAFLLLGVSALNLVSLVVDRSTQNLRNFFPFFLLLSLWGALLWLGPRWGARTQFRKQPSAQGMRQVSIDEIGIHSRWDGGSADVEWKNYIRFTESRDLFLVYSSPACFGMLPKRAFSAEQLDAFRSLLSDKIRSKR
jgi:YcxB-like protein